MHPMTANELRRGFLDFFEQRGHSVVPSASLIPHDPELLFTVAGMVPFKPYFLGEEAAPFSRATSVQKCVRAGGKDSDLEEVGRDGTHLSFFEMLGNFSFGDYFKADAIPMAWEMVTELFGIDPDRLWVTVHDTDDEAVEIWADVVHLPTERIQRLGEDNWWGPPGGPPGPCGPCSEIFVDKGPSYGSDGGPAHGAEERFVEIWNLVFMQYARDGAGVDTELPAKNIDTGAGLERTLAVLQGVDSVFETDVLAPLVEHAQRSTGVRLGVSSTSDVSLRILAEHARTVTFLIGDGVNPSNEGRGYVLRRVIRRAIRHAFLLDVDDLVMPGLAVETVSVMGEAYPELNHDSSRIQDTLAREEEAFRRTLSTGVTILDVALDGIASGSELPGAVAFTLHDTHGFPLELTQEIADERGVAVDVDGFEVEMTAQRERGRASHRAEGRGAAFGDYKELIEAHGATEFVGREEVEAKARVLFASDDTVILDQTPFYAESGGQTGDTGTISSETGEARVLDTVYALPGLVRHVVEVTNGVFHIDQQAVVMVDAERRAAIRRNHTATHILHWALREVLGDHVKQQGSLVAAERLRFDYSHHGPLTTVEIAAVEDLANREILENYPVRHFETTMDHAAQVGAIAFFGDKYGEIVRVLEAGPHSVELCGGTHVRALGDIGSVKIVSESSIGSNTRRIEAVTGLGPIERLRHEEAVLLGLAHLLGVGVDDVEDGFAKRLDELKDLRREVEGLRRELAAGSTDSLLDDAVDGVVVARLDGMASSDLRDLAAGLRQREGVRAVVLGGEPDKGGAALVAAVDPGSGLHAGLLTAEAKKTIKGGGPDNAELVVAGGKDAAAIDEALDQVRVAAGISG